MPRPVPLLHLRVSVNDVAKAGGISRRRLGGGASVARRPTPPNRTLSHFGLPLPWLCARGARPAAGPRSVESRIRRREISGGVWCCLWCSVAVRYLGSCNHEATDGSADQPERCLRLVETTAVGDALLRHLRRIETPNKSGQHSINPIPACSISTTPSLQQHHRQRFLPPDPSSRSSKGRGDPARFAPPALRRLPA